MVIKFEEYLIEQGYKCYEDREKGKEINPYNYMLSFMDLMSVCYKKDNNSFIIGLSQRGFPPTLISPKPKVLCEVIQFENFKVGEQIRDGVMFDILNKFTNEEIYNWCINKILLDYKVSFNEEDIEVLKERHQTSFPDFKIDKTTGKNKIINRYYESN